MMKDCRTVPQGKSRLVLSVFLTLRLRLVSGLLISLFVALFASGCDAPVAVNSVQAALGISGRWRAPAHILEDGDRQNVEYTGAGAWRSDKSTCQGGFTSGGEAFRTYLMAYFPQIDRIGGYACRPIVGNPSQTSVHASGRALDLMIRTTAQGDADNDLGDPIAHWLIQNAERIGIQFIIWDRTSWGPYRPAGDKERGYNGGSAHRDHLHIELSTEAGNMQTPWFSAEQPPPHIDSCAPLAPEGGVIDESNPCTQFLGPDRFWRRTTGQGYGDTLVWTNAIQSDEPSNWARWQIVPSVAGEYSVEVFGGSEFSLHQSSRYELIHDGQSSEITVDQSRLDGWFSLGLFSFSEGGGQSLQVFDNNFQSVAAKQHISVDAIRLIAINDTAPPPVEDPSDPPTGSTDRSGLAGGCAVSDGPGSIPLPLMIFLVSAWLWRRKSPA